MGVQMYLLVYRSNKESDQRMSRDRHSISGEQHIYA